MHHTQLMMVAHTDSVRILIWHDDTLAVQVLWLECT